MARGHLVRDGKPKDLNDWIWVNKVKYFIKDLELTNGQEINRCTGCLLRNVSCTTVLVTGDLSKLINSKFKSCNEDAIVTLKVKPDEK